MGRVAVVGLERHIDERVVGDIDADRHVRVDAAVGADAWRAPSPTSYALGHDAGKHAGHKAAPKAIVERDHALVCTDGLVETWEAKSSSACCSAPLAGAVRRLPRERPGGSLEGPDGIACDPAAVEVALLRMDPFVAQPRRVDAARVERDVTAQRLVRTPRIGIGPRDGPRKPAVDDRVEILGDTFELAHRCAGDAGAQEIHADRGRWEVDRRRVTGFEHAERRIGFRQDSARNLHADASRASRDHRRTGVVPDALHTRDTPCPGQPITLPCPAPLLVDGYFEYGALDRA